MSIEKERLPPAGGVIAGKVYRLKNKGSGKYLNLCGGSDTTGKNINQFKDDGTDTLKWRFIEGAGDYVNAFKIQPILSSTRVVDVQRKGQPIASGGNIQLYSATDDISQHFVFKDTGDGDKSVYICPYTNQNVYMTANGNSNGTHGGTSETSAGNVFVKSSTGTNYQKWFVEETQANPKDIAAGTYYICSVKSGKFLSADVNKNVIQKTFNGALAQQWILSYDSNGYYTIKNGSNQALYLNVKDSVDKNGAGLNLTESLSSSLVPNSQLFRIIQSGSDIAKGKYYRISPKTSILCTLDVKGASVADSAVVQLWKYGEGSHQKWVFIPVLKSGNTTVNKINPTGLTSQDRSNGVSYAVRYATSPSPAYEAFSQDCTNFASQCLLAAGWTMEKNPQSTAESLDGRQTRADSWYYNKLFNVLGVYKGVSRTWSYAPKFVERFALGNSSEGLSAGIGYQYIRYTSIDQLKKDKTKLLAAIKPADILVYYGDDNTATHIMFITDVGNGTIQYAQHTPNRFGTIDELFTRYAGKANDFAFIRMLPPAECYLMQI